MGDWYIFLFHEGCTSRAEDFGGIFTLPPKLDVGVVRDNDTLELRIVNTREDDVIEATDSVDDSELN